LNHDQLFTEDIYLGAFGLLCGGELRRVEVRGDYARKIAVFYIHGSAMEQAERDYYGGLVSVNLRHLKTEVTRLKNAAFAALREEEKRRNGQAAQDPESRYRADQGGKLARRGPR
jgi:hypothetical protein